MGSRKVLIQAWSPNTHWTPWSGMGQTLMLTGGPNNLQDVMEWNKVIPSIQEGK